jgi:hypothetical protein
LFGCDVGLPYVEHLEDNGGAVFDHAASSVIGIDQSTLARKAGVNKSTISRLERAGSKPSGGSSKTLFSVIEALTGGRGAFR